MDSKPYLIFNLGNAQYGIEARFVKEIFPLPELESVPEAPTDIIGILNLRGEILPVMHLALRLGRKAVTCQLSDRVVVLDWQGLQIGLVVEQVQDLQTIEGVAIESQLDYGQQNINPAFIAGIAKLESELAILLDPEALVRQPHEVAALIWQSSDWLDQEPLVTAQRDPLAQQESHKGNVSLDQMPTSKMFGTPLDAPAFHSNLDADSSVTSESQFGGFYDRYCPHATGSERETFSKRADNLRLPLDIVNDATSLYPLAVVNLSGEFFGIDLAVVQEFSSIRNLTAIPCCPNHIVGNMNLRGEIVTLVDIRSLLSLPVNPVKLGSQIVVVQVDDIVAGLPIDDVSDVLYVDPAEIKPLPMTVQEGSSSYLKGILPIFDRKLGVLNLPKMMAQGGLVVNDE